MTLVFTHSGEGYQKDIYFIVIWKGGVPWYACGSQR